MVDRDVHLLGRFRTRRQTYATRVAPVFQPVRPGAGTRRVPRLGRGCCSQKKSPSAGAKGGREVVARRVGRIVRFVGGEGYPKHTLSGFITKGCFEVAGKGGIQGVCALGGGHVAHERAARQNRERRQAVDVPGRREGVCAVGSRFRNRPRVSKRPCKGVCYAFAWQSSWGCVPGVGSCCGLRERRATKSFSRRRAVAVAILATQSLR